MLHTSCVDDDSVRRVCVCDAQLFLSHPLDNVSVSEVSSDSIEIPGIEYHF